MTDKKCSKCENVKSYSEFEKDRTKKDGYRYQCKSCRAEYEKSRGKRNRNEYHKKRIESRRTLIRNIKESTACMDCDTRYPYFVMQFDHREESVKDFEISKYGTRSWETIAAEIEKCDLVCANCHAIRTWKRSVGHSTAL